MSFVGKRRRGRGRGSSNRRGGRRRGRGGNSQRRRIRGRGGGVNYFGLSDRVMALWKSDGQHYKATISSINWDGTYGVVFDMQNEQEFTGQMEEDLQLLKTYKYNPGDRVKALFVKANKWFDAEIVEWAGRGRYLIQFDKLTKQFEQRQELIRPFLNPGDRVMAFWYNSGNYEPATIVEGSTDLDDSGTTGYSIQFDNRDNIFDNQRPDQITLIDNFEEGEEVLALWAADGLFYPAVIMEVGPDDSYSIKFHTFNKVFDNQRSHNLKKIARGGTYSMNDEAEETNLPSR